MSELCGTFSPAFIKITYVLINIDFSVEQFGLCNLLPSAYFLYSFHLIMFIFLHTFAYQCCFFVWAAGGNEDSEAEESASPRLR